VIEVAGLCDRIVKWGLVVLIAFTPLAFGTVEPWSMAFMEWCTVTLFLVFLLGGLWRAERQPEAAGRFSGLELPTGLFLLFCMFQTVPLPARWVAWLSPGSSRLYQAGDLQGWRQAEDRAAGGTKRTDLVLDVQEPRLRSLSVQPGKTWNRIELCVGLLGLFLLISRWADRPEKIVFLLGTVTVVGFFVALEGLVQFLTWNGKIFWVRKVPPSSAFGPFVNHNHFAGYVEMVIPVAIGMAFHCVDARRRSTRSEGRLSSTWASLDDPARMAGGVGWSQAGLAIFAATLLVVTLFLSLSRGGILSATIGGLFLFALVWRRISSRLARWLVALTLPIAALALIAWIGSGAIRQQIGTFQKMESETSFRLRSLIWQTVLRELPQYAWVGSGLGTFEDSFAPFTPPGSSKRWDKAHNDYLQLLWETGIIGCALVLFGVLVFVRRYWWPAIQGRAHPLGIFRVAAAVSLASIALHSLVDFNLQIGANAFLCVLLAGLLVAMQHVEQEQSAKRPVLVHLRETTA